MRVRVIELPIGTAVPTEKSTAVTWQTGSKHCSRRNKESKESNRGVVGDASRTQHNNCSKHYSTEKQSPVPRRIVYPPPPPHTAYNKCPDINTAHTHTNEKNTRSFVDVQRIVNCRSPTSVSNTQPHAMAKDEPQQQETTLPIAS